MKLSPGMEGFGTPGRTGGSQGEVPAYSFGTSPTSMHPNGSPFTQTGVGGLNQGP